MPVPTSAIVQMRMPRTPIVLGSWPRLDPPMRPLGEYVFHCRQPPALGGAGETPAPPWSQLSLPKSSGVLDHLVQVRVVERDQRPALQVPDEERPCRGPRSRASPPGRAAARPRGFAGWPGRIDAGTISQIRSSQCIARTRMAT